MTMLRHSTLVIAIILAAVSCAGAQTFFYPNFNTVPNLTLGGTTVQSAGVIELTQFSASNSGTMFYDQPVAVTGGFDCIFTFQINAVSPGSHADGMTFMIHNDPAGNLFLGNNGGSLGYDAALTNALIVEIDTYVNGDSFDTSNNEISIHTGGAGVADNSESESIAQFTPLASMTDSLPHFMRVEYIPGTLNVYLDNLTVPVISVPYDFATGGTYVGGSSVGGLSLPNGTAWVGFTGTTGGITQVSQIIDWSWTSVGPDPCYDSRVGITFGGPFDVLTIDGDNGGFSRTVHRNALQPFSIQMATTAGIPTPFAIFARIGIPGPSDIYNSPFGPLCFTPSVLIPQPQNYLLVDSLGGSPTAILPGSPAPWSFTLPFGSPFVLDLVLQAVVQENPTIPQVTISNGVILRIEANPPPTITSIVPNDLTPGMSATITGTGFLAGAAVSVNGVPQTVQSVSSTLITFTSNVATPCDTPMTVRNLDTNMVSGLLNPSPIVTSVPFTSGPAAGGGFFVLVGTLDPASILTWDGSPLTPNTLTASALTAVIPPGVSGQTVLVVFTSPSGCTFSTGYTYQ